MVPCCTGPGLSIVWREGVHYYISQTTYYHTPAKHYDLSRLDLRSIENPRTSQLRHTKHVHRRIGCRPHALSVNRTLSQPRPPGVILFRDHCPD